MPEVIMPKMGDATEVGTLVKWLVSEGDEVEEGDPIAEIEIDKVEMEIEAKDSGTLYEFIAGEGQEVPVGEAIAVILGEGEEPPERDGAAQAEEAGAEETQPESPSSKEGPFNDSPSIGIDFGTTNSSMAWYNPETQQAEIILNAEGEPKTPSLVYFGDEQVLVGKPVEDLIEDSENFEEEERADVTRRVVRSIKRNLLNPPVIPVPGKREPVRPVEVVAEILKKLKRDAEEGHFREEVERAVITCPGVFDAPQRKVIFAAAAAVGFGIVELVEEPVAAAMAFARLGRKVGEGVLVYDLGGGTFDLAVVAREEDPSSKEGPFHVPMEPDGDDHTGGDDFDRAIYEHCDGIYRQRLGRSINVADEALNVYFLTECRKQKERLSYREMTTIREHLDGELFKAELDRPTFEGLIGEQVEKTVRKTAAMVRRAEDEGQRVDTVVLIGGSSQVPLVARRLNETLKLEPQKFANKDYAVALGAAYYTDVLEVPSRYRYRRALEISWADETLSREEVEHLGGLAKELGLSGEEASEIEVEVMGALLQEVLDRQRGEYREAVEEVWEALRRLGTLSGRHGLDTEQAEEIERQVLGETVGAILSGQRQSEEVRRSGQEHGTGASAAGTASDAAWPAARGRPGDPNRTGTEQEYSDPSAGPLFGRGYRGQIGEVPVRDEEIEKRIRTRIGEDPRTLHLPLINVEVNDGVADIRGEAHSEEDKTVVEEIATGIEGVTEVRNLMSVTISSGPSIVEVPDLVGLSRSEAGSALASASLNRGSQNEATSDTVSEGEIIRQDPVARTKAERGSCVSVTVSTGPEEKATTTVPNAPARSIPQTPGEPALESVGGGLLFGLGLGSLLVEAVLLVLYFAGILVPPPPWWLGLLLPPIGLLLPPSMLVVGGVLLERASKGWYRAILYSMSVSLFYLGFVGMPIGVGGVFVTWVLGNHSVPPLWGLWLLLPPSMLVVGVWLDEGDEEKIAPALIGVGLLCAIIAAVVYSWTGEYFTLTHTLSGHSGFVQDIAFSPDGKLLASSVDNTIKLWDPQSGKEHRTLSGHSGGSVAFSPDGKLLASDSVDNTIKLWDPQSGEELRTLSGHSGPVGPVAFSPDGGLLASGSDDETVKLWDPQSGEELRTLSGHSDKLDSVHNPVRSVAFSPDGKLLASGSDNDGVKLWDPQSGEELRTLSGHSGGSVAFSPDGKLLANSSFDYNTKLWDPQSGEELRTLSEHKTNHVQSLTFSPDGSLLVSGDGRDDETVKLWDPQSGELCQTLGALASANSNSESVAFSSDGQLLASSHLDKTIKIWKRTGGKQ